MPPPRRRPPDPVEALCLRVVALPRLCGTPMLNLEPAGAPPALRPLTPELLTRLAWALRAEQDDG